jgi:hypothetical protein
VGVVQRLHGANILSEPNFRFHLCMEGSPGVKRDRPSKEEVLVSYKEVQEKLRDIGIVISKKGETHRINYFSGLEDTARYTTSLQDALAQGLEMAKPRRR